jgi:phosphoglycerate dehydrogenase-like enzyme
VLPGLIDDIDHRDSIKRLDRSSLVSLIVEEVMRIGIIGTGHMGRALGLRWARLGHQVLFGSRDLDKAKAVAEGGSV